MRLQRIAFHRVVRILSGILPVLIVAFVGVAVWNYWARTNDDQPGAARPLESLPPGAALVAKGVNADTPDFYLEASRLVVMTDEAKTFEDVIVTVKPRKAGDEERHIRGNLCNHVVKTGQVSCTGKVSVELDALTTAFTEEIHYDSKADLISSPVPTRLERPGHMTGKAGQMQHFVKTGLLRLTDGVDIDLTEGGGLLAGLAVFQQQENWVTVSQGIELKSANGWLRGGSGRADLAPGTYRPTKVKIENGASMESRSASVFTLNSEWLQSDLTTEGRAEHVLARGKVVAKNESSSGGDKAVSGELEAPEIEAWLNAMGRPETIEARQHPVFQNPQGTLTAENTIRIDYAARSIKTQGKSLLTSEIDGRETSSIDGRDFVIDEKQGSRIFSTQSRATLKSSGLTTKGDTTRAVIDGATNKIASLDQTGMVTLEDSARNRSGKAGRLQITENGDRIVLDQNNPQVKEGTRVLGAQTITMLQAEKRFIGEGNVTMTDTSAESGGGFVQARHADGTEDRIKYSGKVELFTEAGKIEADELVAYLKTKGFDAEKNVVSTGDRFRARSDRLILTNGGNEGQTAVYTGNVTATKTSEQGVDLVLTTQALKVELKSGKMERLLATEGADITQGTQWKGYGDSVDYNLATGQVVLKGTSAKEAEVRRGPEFVRGCVITVIPKGREEVLPCGDRSVTSTIKIQK
jgi:lipopolysaccharide export system protein LptA